MSTPEHGERVSVDVLRGRPTEEELAALMAVVSEAYAGESDAAVADDRPERSAWARSARGLRAPLDRGAVWGRFGG